MTAKPTTSVADPDKATIHCTGAISVVPDTDPDADSEPADEMVLGKEEAEALLQMVGDLVRREILPISSRLDEGDEGGIAECWDILSQTGLDRIASYSNDVAGPEGAGSESSYDILLGALELLAYGDGGLAMSLLLSNAAVVAGRAFPITPIVEGERWVLVPVSGEEVGVSGSKE